MKVLLLLLTIWILWRIQDGHFIYIEAYDTRKQCERFEGTIYPGPQGGGVIQQICFPLGIHPRDTGLYD